MKARDLLSETKYKYIAGDLDREVNWCRMDSRQVQKDDAFVDGIHLRNPGKYRHIFNKKMNIRYNYSR